MLLNNEHVPTTLKGENSFFRFPIPHFGKLVGFMYLIASIVQFLQIPLLMWAENGNFTQVSFFLSGHAHPRIALTICKRNPLFSSDKLIV